MSSPSTKDTTQVSQTAPSQPGTGPAPTADKTAPLAASPGEQEKQPATNSGATPAPKAEGAAAQPAIVEPPAAATTYQAPASSSEKPPLPPSDPTPDPPATKFDADDDDDDEYGQDPASTTTAPAGSGPTPRVLTVEERRRRAKLLIIHTRLAKFFTWILLLGFVILPGTFNHDSKIKDVPLLALGFVCSAVNVITIFGLWRLRKNDVEWVFTNLFFAGLVNSFSGMITTFVNIFGVQGGPHGAPTKATIALTSMFTIIYAILTFIYFRKRTQLWQRRASRGSVV